MRIMLDSNVIISALLFPSVQMDRLFKDLFDHHTIVLSSYIIDELHRVIRRKFPAQTKALDRLLVGMSYELVYTPLEMEPDLVKIRDEKDYPILYSAITEEIDILITGDLDFKEIDLETPKIMTPKEYLEKYIGAENT